jgi:phosphotriesterase-related protein
MEPVTSLFRTAAPLPIGVESGYAMSVLGPVAVADLGVTLMHEHILLDASSKLQVPCDCAARAFAERPVAMEMLGQLRLNPVGNRDNCQLLDADLAVEELRQYTELGGRTVVDATPIGSGRDLAALQRIARRSGLNVIGGSGYYLEPSHPPYVRDASIEDLSEKIMFDVGGLKRRPSVVAGIIGEIGVSPDFTAQEEKCLRAASRAAARTRVPLSIHLPGWKRYGDRVLDIVEQEGADLAHTILCHMNPSLRDRDYQRRLARRGCFLEYDMIGIDFYFAEKKAQAPSDEDNAIAIAELIADGLIERLLLSHDVFLKMMLTKYGGHGYGHILRNFAPRLIDHGVSHANLDALMIGNPARVFSSKAVVRPTANIGVGGGRT